MRYCSRCLADSLNMREPQFGRDRVDSTSITIRRAVLSLFTLRAAKKIDE